MISRFLQNIPTCVCNLCKSRHMISEIVSGEDFDVLKRNLWSKTIKSFTKKPKMRKQSFEFFSLTPLLIDFLYFSYEILW